MGNSTITLQTIMDGVSAIGDLNPVFNETGGWADEPALTIANDVMSELLSIRFPWKWNRIKIPPFPLTSLQQDYATPLTGMGWLENGLRIDVNNPTYPPPSWPVYAVRDLDMDSVIGGYPFQVCSYSNADLEQGTWPGANKPYIQPVGATSAPNNPPTNITDSFGNILVLTTYGTTGTTAPAAPAANAAAGTTVADGTCVWTVVDPNAQGFRFRPRPPQSGQVWLMRLFGQKKAPYFTRMQQKIDPIPDDQSKWFRDGCIAYAHRYSANPTVKNRFETMKGDWFGAMELATKQNDREDESRGFFPDKSVMQPTFLSDPGPYPYRYGWR